MKVTTQGLWLRELAELVWYFQGSATALGVRAFDPAALAMMGARSNWPSFPEPSARARAACHRQRRISLALAALPPEQQRVLRECYEAIGVAADDRAKRYGAAAGAVRAAWRRSEPLTLLAADLRGLGGAAARKLRRRRDELEDMIGWHAWAAAVRAHDGYVEARQAQRDQEQAELVAAVERGTPAQALAAAARVEKIPSPSKLRALRVAALLMEMFPKLEAK